MGTEGLAPLIPNLCTRWSAVISTTLRPLYSREGFAGTHPVGGWEDPRAGLDIWRTEISLTLPENRTNISRSAALCSLRELISSCVDEFSTSVCLFWTELCTEPPYAVSNTVPGLSCDHASSFVYIIHK
jgi:hypothetical protein